MNIKVLSIQFKTFREHFEAFKYHFAALDGLILNLGSQNIKKKFSIFCPDLQLTKLKSTKKRVFGFRSETRLRAINFNALDYNFFFSTFSFFINENTVVMIADATPLIFIIELAFSKKKRRHKKTARLTRNLFAPTLINIRNNFRKSSKRSSLYRLLAVYFLLFFLPFLFCS